MANWGAAFGGLGQGLEGLSGIIRRIELMKQQQEEETRRQLIVQDQKARIDRANEIFKDPSLAAKPNERLLNRQIESVGKAKSLGDLGNESQYREGFLASGGKDYLKSRPVTPDLALGEETGGEGERLHSVFEGRKNALETEANADTQEIKRKNPDGSETSIFVPKRKLAGNEYTTGLSARQLGANEGTKKVAEAPGTIEASNAVENGTRKAKVTTAGQTAFAQAQGQGAGHAPFEKPDILIDPANPDTGVAAKWNAKTQKYDTQPAPGLPPGAARGMGPKPLTQTQVDQISSMNAGETQGVKVLAALKNAGLDKVNDPLDPRWQKFWAATLKISTDDLAKMDIQQRTAYVQAQMVKALLGGRPAQWTTQLFLQHLPDGAMTGSKLNQVMNDVLEQVNAKRDEIKALTGRDDLDPTSGMTWKQWIQANQGPSGPSVEQSVDDKIRKLNGGG